MDSYGHAMVEAGATWESINAHTFKLTLIKPFGLVLEALSKVSSYAPFIMSKKAIEAAGSGPVTRIDRSEEHTSETPVTNAHLVCRLLLENKNLITIHKTHTRTHITL